MGKNIRFYSLSPSLNNQMGHFFEYNLSVNRAAQKNGWRFLSLITFASSVAPLPRGWLKVLPIDYAVRQKSVWKQWIFPFFTNAVFFVSVFWKIKKRKDAILFIEQYTLPFLAAIVAGVLCVRPRLRFWHLLRFAPSQLKKGGKIHFLLHRLMEKVLGKERVLFLTDSEKIAEEIQQRFDRLAKVVPIPHAQTGKWPRETRQDGALFCWWPGVPREEKGLRFIEKLAKVTPSSGKARLLVAENLCKNSAFQHRNIQFVPLDESREEYEWWLHRVDVVLLPYEPSIYFGRTSGIFVEAILARKIPLTIEGTWMACELRKYDLSELLVDWESPEQVWADLPGLCQSKILRDKLEVMREGYQAFHSLERFTAIFAELEKK